MMTSSNGDIFRVTGHLCGEFTGPRWFPCTKASDAELWCFFDLRPKKLLSKQSWGRWFETPSHPLWRHRNEHLISFESNIWYLFWPSTWDQLKGVIHILSKKQQWSIAIITKDLNMTRTKQMKNINSKSVILSKQLQQMNFHYVYCVYRLIILAFSLWLIWKLGGLF